MPKKELSHQFIKSLNPPDKPIAYYDEVQPGLILRLSKAGTKSFSYRYQFHGKKRRFKIGTFPGMSLADARDKIHELKTNIKNGIDPQAQREERLHRPEPKKFKYLAEQFKKRHLPTLKESTQKTYTERIDGEMIPAFGNMYIKDISRGDIIELLEEIAFDRGSPYQSNRVRAILSSMFNFGVRREIAEYNPVKLTQPVAKEEKRDRVLAEDEIKRLWNQGFNTVKEPTQSLFKILLILGQRLGETRKMQWDNIEYDKPYKRTYIDKDGNEVKEAFLVDVWTIPKEQTKANRKHFVPLPPAALEIIEELKNNSRYVFESPDKKDQPIKWVHTTFKELAKRAKVDNIRIHDLRRTAATYMAEGGTDRTILGKVLNHKGLAGDNQVTARYDRHGYMDEKRTALNRWTHKLQQIINGKETKIHKIG